jgi:SAM-dependent methyltransferase
MAFFFGLYHWQRRARRLFVALVVGAVGLASTRSDSRVGRAAGLLGVAWAGRRGAGALHSLLTPLPWVVERYKYSPLAAALPTAGADRWLDLGCGTGRSIVGLAPAIPEDCRVLGLDVFDDRVVLGNGPGLAARNARQAGVDAAMLRGDAARLPADDDSQAVVTACRLLHDLPRSAARSTLEEAHRVCEPGGAVGVLELPTTHEGVDDPPEEYWPALVAQAGFAVERVEHVPRRRSDGHYVVVVGRA